MPSSFYQTSSNGLNTISASASGNKTSSIAKIPGTATLAAPNVTKVGITGVPSVLDGSSNDALSTTLIASTGNGSIGHAIGYALGTGVGSVDQVRKQAELTVSNYNVAYSDPLHDSVRPREVITTASGYYHDRQGRVLSATGAVVIGSGSLPSVSGTFFMNGGLPDQGNNGAKGVGQGYYYKLGANNTEKTLPVRTQQ